MKSLPNKFIGLTTSLIRFAVRRKVISSTKKLMKRHNIPNKKTEGEKEYMELWRPLYSKVSPLQYRLYSHYAGKEVGIVPEDVCHNLINPIMNPVKFRGCYEDKNQYDKMFPTDFTPGTILRKIGGQYFDPQYRLITTLNDELLTRMVEGFDRIVLKPSIDTSSGKGVLIFDRTDRHEGAFIATDGKTTLNVELLNAQGPDMIMQECLRQSDFLNKLNSTSLNTIRITTYRSVKTDKVVTLGTLIRVGQRGSVVDNAHAGGVLVGVDDHGRLGKFVCNQYGDKVDVFNGIDFANEELVLPDFDRIKAFAVKVGESIAHHRLLQQDITVDEKGVIRLVEFNISGFAPWSYQFTGHTAFRTYTTEIIEYCKQNKGKAQKLVLYFA